MIHDITRLLTGWMMTEEGRGFEIWNLHGSLIVRLIVRKDGENKSVEHTFEGDEEWWMSQLNRIMEELENVE